MTKLGRFFRLDGLLIATTIGAGIFALPYVFYKSGWILGLGYLLFFGLVMAVTHALYWGVLVKAGGREGLLGLAREYLGRTGFFAGFMSILGGLLFSQVAFLVLAHSFLKLIFPGISFSGAVVIFWLAAVIPLLFGVKRFIKMELFGGVIMAAVILLIFFGSLPFGDLSFVPKVNLDNFFLPFGAILFSLAAWTAIDPMISSEEKAERFKKGYRWREIFSGTLLVVVIYLLFILAILSSSGEVAPDGVSGLVGWAGWKLGLLGIFGLFAIWTTYLPFAFESRVLLEKDLKRSKTISLVLVIFLPVVLIVLGLTSFLDAVFLVGGVFLAVQYFILLLIARRALDLSFKMRVATFLMSLIFVAGAIYEIYYFVF